MPSILRLACFLPVGFAVVCVSTMSGQNAPVEQTERVAASFLLALGRLPSADEVSTWAASGPAAMADLLARHRAQLQGDATAQRTTNIKAWEDAFGDSPSAGDISGTPGAATYTDLMQRHLERLASHPAEYAGVIHRAYRLVVRREAYPEEIEYWNRYDTLSHVLLVGCIEDWARRNQPGLMVTAGTPTVSVNSQFLATIRLSPAVAAEARVAFGLPLHHFTDHPAASGRNLVAAGAAQVVTGGRIHFVAAGAADRLGAPMR